MTKDELHSLKRNLYHWAKENLRGTSVTNKQTGNIAAKFTHSEKNIHSERKNAPSFEYYECPIEIEENGFNAVISVKLIVATSGDRRIYYHHYLGDLKIKPPSTLVRQPKRK